jgi:hypothetical protein
VQVTAVGGPGSSFVAADGTTVAGGKGANVSATVPVPNGTTTLYVAVGAANVDGLECVWNSSGCLNGAAGAAGHAGGAASDVRTCSLANCPFFHAGGNVCIGGFIYCDSRLVVAGGGGGAGGSDAATGGPAGNSAVRAAGAGGTNCAPGFSGGFGGPPGAGPGVSPGGTDIVEGGQDNICLVPTINTTFGTTQTLETSAGITNPVTCVNDRAANPGWGGAGYVYGGARRNRQFRPHKPVAGGGGGGSSFWISSAINTSMVVGDALVDRVELSSGHAVAVHAHVAGVSARFEAAEIHPLRGRSPLAGDPSGDVHWNGEGVIAPNAVGTSKGAFRAPGCVRLMFAHWHYRPPTQVRSSPLRQPQGYSRRSMALQPQSSSCHPSARSADSECPRSSPRYRCRSRSNCSRLPIRRCY